MPVLLRSASLTGFAEVARSVGLNPHAMLAGTGLPSDALSDPDLKVPADGVRHLLELSADLSGEPAFGLRMAETRRLSNLGPVGLLMREEPTLRRALDALLRFSRLHNAAVFLKVEVAGDVVVIREEVIVGKAAPVRQSTELAIGVVFRLLSVFLGPNWRAKRICFAHAAPKDRSVHWRVFGRNVEFGHDFNGIVCNARDLEAPNPGADPVIARYARQVLEASLRGDGKTFTNEVRQLVFMLLPAGHCRIELVAQHVGMGRRTVHRQLAKEGETFSGIVEAARHELAARYIDEGERPLAEVSELLGFSAPSAFSRWYRQHAGASASRRRATAAGP
ncbi:AraC family transcriptional regulator [Variovorax sp. J22P240]|uniref:AraC family transcriptional regulator n=1 Tax=Variovorax sp. J22P240 TaxID=3053514 RepID=UPI00257760C1|nr:AraC family transcriptional regulator [Variovorax sp. J22P240]MDM0000688.1 AraC family transcriptional regulator [Variovorax sp. J22P240]